MRKVIYKYPLQIKDEFEVEIHKLSASLCIQMQNFVPVMWALVDTDSALYKAKIYCRGTGNEFQGEVGTYLGTVQDDNLVWHFFLEQKTLDSDVEFVVGIRGKNE